MNILGAYAVAAFTAGQKVENIFSQAYVALGTAMATYNAQNVGAGNVQRVREGFRSANIIGVSYAIITGGNIDLLGKIFCISFHFR